MNDNNWRKKTLDELLLILTDMEGFVSLSIFGSMLNDQTLDIWSDIDALLVVKNKSIKNYFPTTKWLEKINSVFTIQQSSNSQGSTTKIIFDDFRKIDLIITTESKILDSDPFWSKQNIIHSNSDIISKKLMGINKGKSKFDKKNYQIETLSSEFWFIAYTALTKIIREDLLIGLHLSLDLYKMCLVLAMWMRDKETGTNIHRIGGVNNDLINKLNIKIKNFSKRDLIALIDKCSKEFDAMSLTWDSSYKCKYVKFKTLINTALENIK